MSTAKRLAGGEPGQYIIGRFELGVGNCKRYRSCIGDARRKMVMREITLWALGGWVSDRRRGCACLR